jgi:transposase InsO family protein
MARAADLPHLHGFANGLELDRDAVSAGLTLPHHNGRTEGVHQRRPDPPRDHPRRHGTQFTSWTFTERAHRAGLLPSLGTVGDRYDNAVAEAFWARMQTELLDRQRWRTRVELANAIFEYVEGFYNRRRRHSALNWMSLIEFETITRPSSPVSSPTSP